jgi:hypothetical protein
MDNQEIESKEISEKETKPEKENYWLSQLLYEPSVKYV